ncbi:MAG TPA: phenylacetate--CoA ligase family protein [Clostridia bacterium]|nr:phenylacetate--CoA ligase family protein [Clostridia bacterium]
MGRPRSSLDEWVRGKVGLGPGEELTREKLADYQLGKLRALVDYVSRHSPFYRRHLQGYPLTALNSLDDLAELPFTTEEDLRAAGLKMLCVSQSRINRIVTLDTSGTTGRPKRICFTPADQALTVEFFQQGLATFTWPGEKVLILLPGERPGSIGDLLARAMQNLGVVPIPFGVGHSLAEMLAKLAETQAQVIIGIPVHVLALARYHRLWEPEKTINLKRVLLTTDYVAQAVVEVLQDSWQCEVFRYYGMTEMGYGGGIECRRHEGYHLYEGDFLFEIVDPVRGTRVPAGAWGEVVVTTLTRNGMPLVRYRTGDIARLLPEPCPCGSVLARLGPVKRRVKGWIRVDDETGFSIGELDEILFTLPGVVDFMVWRYGAAEPFWLEIEVEAIDRALSPGQIRRALETHPAMQSLLAQGRLQLTARGIPAPACYRPKTGKRRMEVRVTRGQP